MLTSCIERNSNKDDYEVTPDIGKLRREYVLSYNNPIEFESFHHGKDGESLIVYGKYYCLFDSGIVVPGKYNLDDTSKIFRTHNFAEDIAIISNGDTILRKTITKDDFNNILPDHLKRYAIIFDPKFEGYSSDTDMFDFVFSVSVPLTDVGQSMQLSLKRDGQIKIEQGD
jgi:hypothetical protein